MRIAYFECFSGISGDMFLGALLHAGVSEDLLRRTVSALNIGAELQVRRVDRSGISATKVDVLVNGTAPSHEGSHDHAHSHSHSHHHHGQNNAPSHSHSGQEDIPDRQHEYDRASEKKYTHGRSLAVIRDIIARADIPESARKTAVRAFELLGQTEAAIHNVPVESIHFHEVGAVDAIVDIVCAAVGCHALGVDAFVCSPLNVGAGMVECAHGIFPVPAPATLALLQGAPVYSSGVKAELVTPTGAALIRALGCQFSDLPSMKVESIGYGAGMRNLKGTPNVLRISVGELLSGNKPLVESQESFETITVLETTIDDSNPQIIGYVSERLLIEGALDVFVVQAQMKKNRPGVLVTVLCDGKVAQRLRDLLFRETSTIGIRTREERRDCLQRQIVPVMTQWGVVHVKESSLGGVMANFSPEYEDCRRIAEENGLPLKLVQQEVSSAYIALKQQTASTISQTSPTRNSKSQIA